MNRLASNFHSSFPLNTTAVFIVRFTPPPSIPELPKTSCCSSVRRSSSAQLAKLLFSPDHGLNARISMSPTQPLTCQKWWTDSTFAPQKNAFRGAKLNMHCLRPASHAETSLRGAWTTDKELLSHFWHPTNISLFSSDARLNIYLFRADIRLNIYLHLTSG